MGEPVESAVTIAAEVDDEWRTLALLSHEDGEWLLSQCDVADLREAFCRELRAALDRPEGGVAHVSEIERDALRAVVRESGEAAPANVVQLGEQLADAFG